MVTSISVFSHKLLQFTVGHTRFIVLFACWLIGFYVSSRAEFAAVYLTLTAFVLIFTNLSDSGAGGKSAGARPVASAYAAFNPGAAAISGSFTADQFDRQLRHRPAVAAEAVADDDTAPPAAGDGHFLRKSKNANKTCVCGSGRKYKHCCSPLTVNRAKEAAELAEWKREWAS